MSLQSTLMRFPTAVLVSLSVCLSVIVEHAFANPLMVICLSLESQPTGAAVSLFLDLSAELFPRFTLVMCAILPSTEDISVPSGLRSALCRDCLYRKICALQIPEMN